MARTSGSFMIQPTKDEIRVWLSVTRKKLKEEVTRRQIAEQKLRVAIRKLGTLVIEGKIDISAERLGELVIQTASEEDAASEEEAAEENCPILNLPSTSTFRRFG